MPVGDGQLTFAGVQDRDNLFGAVDLLTLSASDTAMGNNSKEAEGFAYPAQSLGAKSVAASLWNLRGGNAGTVGSLLQTGSRMSADAER